MKKMMWLLLAISLLSTSALAEGSPVVFGARAGYSVNPDQIFFGGHADFGKILGPLRVVPNIEAGFGDNFTVVAINGDLIYDIENLPLGVGAELGFLYSKWDDKGLANLPGVDIDTSSTDVGVTLLAEFRLTLPNTKTLFFQAKVGLTNAPDFKILAGYNF